MGSPKIIMFICMAKLFVISGGHYTLSRLPSASNTLLMADIPASKQLTISASLAFHLPSAQFRVALKQIDIFRQE